MLKQALQHWQDWGLDSQPSLIHIFTNGQNHHTGLIKVGEQRLVLKIFSSTFDPSLFAHTMEIERWAAKQNIAPNTVFANQHVQILEHIDDQGFTENKSPTLAKALRKLHTSKRSEHLRFDLLTFTNEYLNHANEQMHQWHKQLLPILNEFINDPTPWVFCHNDLVRENCLFDSNGNAFIIDWEFAQHHNPWFDIAAVVLYFKLSKVQATVFLESYKTNWGQCISERIFISSQIAVLWTDLLWNLKKHGSDYQKTHLSRFKTLASLAQQLSIELDM